MIDYIDHEGPQSKDFGKLGRTLFKGGGGGGATTSTVTNTQQLPAYAQPYAEQLMSRSASLSNKAFTPYTGQRIANLNSNQLSGIDSIANASQGNANTLNMYQGNLNRTLNGDFMDVSKNPYWASQSKAITEAYNTGTRPQTDSAFARQGAFGGTAYNDAVRANQQSLGTSLSNLAGNIYNMERQNQMNANPSGLFSAQMSNAQNQIGVGDIQRSYLQDLLSQAYSDWNAAQEQPYKNLDVLAKGLSGSVGNAGQSFASTSTPYQATPFANYLGAGLAGAGLLSALGN